MSLDTVKAINKIFETSDDPWGIHRPAGSVSSIKNLLPQRIIKVLKFLRGAAKDIFMFQSAAHKSPSLKFTSKTCYEKVRMRLDVAVSRLVIYSAPKKIRNELLNIFNKGTTVFDLGDLAEIDSVLSGVMEYAVPGNGGANPYILGDKKTVIEKSSSTYFEYSLSDSQKINAVIEKRTDENLQYYISALAGYRCSLGNTMIHLAITIGQNSNSELHQDTWCGCAKGFVYLSDVTEKLSPFEYLENSYPDFAFRSKISNNSVLNESETNQPSTRLRGTSLENGLKKFPIKSITGKSGTLILANTSGYHRKGNHDSDLPRVMIYFGFKRKGLAGKFFTNLVAICKFWFKNY